MPELRRKTRRIEGQTIKGPTGAMKLRITIPGALRCWRKWIQPLLLLGIFSILALGCSTVETKSRKAAGVNLSQYRTFDFAEPIRPANSDFANPTNEARVKAAIRSELEKHGLRPGEPADLHLYLHLKTKMKLYDKTDPSIESRSLSANLGTYYELLYDNDWGTQNIIAYPEGTLVVQAVDVKQNRRVWEGIAIGVLHHDLLEKEIEARIQEAVAGMFRDFPEHSS